VDGRSRTAVTRVEWRGHVWSMLLAGNLVFLASKLSVAGFAGLGLKTQAKVPRRNGRHVAASRTSRRGEAFSRRVQLPSDEDYLRLDHNSLGLCGSTQNI
jgi:hypothetical protein